MSLVKEAEHTTWEDFDHCTVAEFSDNYWGCDNPIVAEDDATVWFTTIGAPFDEGYAVTVVEHEDGWMCELTGMGATGVAQSDFHETPQEAWEESRAMFIEMEG